MKKIYLLVPAAVLVGAVLWIYARRSAPPEVPFVEVKRERLVSSLATNGKIEPVEWIAVHAGMAGLARRVPARRGSPVREGDVLVELDAGEARAALAAAETRIEQAQAELRTLEGGGRPADLAAIRNELEGARLELETARKEAESLERLADRSAATRQEAVRARERVGKIRIQIDGIEKRRGALVSQEDRAAAASRLKDAQAAAERAKELIRQAVIRAPLPGTVYDLPVREGAYLEPGSLVARIGRLDRVRAVVYVDEPELGRAGAGMPVSISWDALPGKEWRGRVEQLPAQITALGTRQVGEVVVLIDNPGGDLVPGANINATILSRVAENVLTLPREALRREDGRPGVYRLNGETIEWRPVETGISSVTRLEILGGLREGDRVAGATDVRLRSGMAVRPAAR